MKMLQVVVTAALGCLLIGCAASNNFSQAQLNAIETREVDAPMEATFNAASGALFDAGYIIAMSDRQGGLLTGTRTKDQTAARIWISHAIRDTNFTISFQLRPIDDRRTAVRAKTAVNGEPVVNKEAIDQLWVLMQRQVLMKEPLAPATQPR